MISQRNPEGVGVIIGAMLVAIGLATVFLPAIVAMDMMSGGYALRFIGLFVVFSGLVVLWVYGRRFAIMARILGGQNVLARWQYAPADARAHAQREFKERWQQNRSMFLIVAALFIVIGLPVLIIPVLKEGDRIGLIIVAIYVGIIPLLGLVAWVAPRVAYRRALRSGSADVIISADGVYIRGVLETWREPFSSLTRVTIDHHATTPRLRFEIRNLTRLGTVHYATRTIDVPIPAEQMASAARVMRFLAGQPKAVDGAAEETQDG